jgi:hypothetical protein
MSVQIGYHGDQCPTLLDAVRVTCTLPGGSLLIIDSEGVGTSSRMCLTQRF